MDAARVHEPQRLGHRSAAERGSEAQLVAAGEEHAVGFLEHRQLLAILALLAGLERQHPHLRRLEIAEQLLVTTAGGAQLGSGGKHGDPRLALAAQLDEPLEDGLVAELVLGAADRNDEATLLAFRHARWAHEASSLTR